MGGSHLCGLHADGSASCFELYEDVHGNIIDHKRSEVPESRLFTQVSAGSTHSCGILESGELLCWGEEIENFALLSAPSGSNFVQMSAGEYFSCAVQDTGRIQCWGKDYCFAEPEPDCIRTPLASDYSQVSVGRTHACALRLDGGVDCWGKPSDALTAPDAHFRSISTGTKHNCGTLTDGSILCWGQSNTNWNP